MREEGKPLLGRIAIEEIVRVGVFCAAPPWGQSGWFEKLLWGWLTEREKALSEFVLPNGFAIGLPWKKVARNFVVALLLATLAGFAFPALKLWAIGGGLFITGAQAYSRFLDSGRAFQLTRLSRVMIPMYAGYAVGFRALS